MARETEIKQSSYSSGVNEEDFLANLRETEIRVGINVIITKRGSLAKREGSSEYGTDAGTDPVYAIKGFKDEAGVLYGLKFRDTALVEYHAGAWDTVVKGSLTASKFLQMSDFQVASTSAAATGTAESGADYSLTDSGASWTVNGYRNYIVRITAGTGSGQVRTILENTATVLTVDGRWDINPDSSSVFDIYAKVKGLVCSNGTDTTFKVTGSAGTLSATDMTWVPKMPVIITANNRLWGIDGTKIRWSSLANGEAWGELNYIDTAEELVSIGKVGDAVAVYSRTKTGVVVGTSPDNFQFNWRDQAHGCMAANSVANWSGLCLALSHDGVYAFDGSYNRLVSRRINPSIRAIKESERVNSTGFVFENKYYLMHAKDSVSTVKDRIWVMDLTWSFKADDPDLGVWTVFEGLDVNVMGVFTDSNGIRTLYYGSSTGSKVYTLYDGTYVDSLLPIIFQIDTREFDLDTLGVQKKLGLFYYEGASQIVSSILQCYRNINGAGFVVFGTVEHFQVGGLWDAGYWDIASWGGAERTIKRLRPGARGRTIQYSFRNNFADQPVEIFKYENNLLVHKYH